MRIRIIDLASVTPMEREVLGALRMWRGRGASIMMFLKRDADFRNVYGRAGRRSGPLLTRLRRTGMIYYEGNTRDALERNVTVKRRVDALLFRANPSYRTRKIRGGAAVQAFIRKTFGYKKPLDYGFARIRTRSQLKLVNYLINF